MDCDTLIRKGAHADIVIINEVSVCHESCFRADEPSGRVIEQV
jgi:hypothetical protein